MTRGERTMTAVPETAIHQRIKGAVEPFRDSDDQLIRTVALLLRQIGPIIDRDVEAGLPLGLLPLRVRMVIEALEDR